MYLMCENQVAYFTFTGISDSIDGEPTNLEKTNRFINYTWNGQRLRRIMFYCIYSQQKHSGGGLMTTFSQDR